jgi:hypothetical protein
VVGVDEVKTLAGWTVVALEVAPGAVDSAVVLRLVKLLSIAAALAVFLFASARSRSNIVSSAAADVFGASFLELLQPVFATRSPAHAISAYLERVFMEFAWTWGQSKRHRAGLVPP